MGILQDQLNDVTVAVTEAKKSDDQPAVAPEGTTAPAAQTEKPREKMIVMDGPLSKIYTAALNSVYNKRRSEADSISTETQQMDAVMVADVHNLLEKKEAAEKEGRIVDPAYVYATDVNQIREQGVTEAFDEIRRAINHDDGAVVICIEQYGGIDNNLSILTDFLAETNAKVFFSRDATMNYLKGM